MPKKAGKRSAFTHNDCRSLLCLICRQKKSSLSDIIPGSDIHGRVKEYFDSEFDPTDQLKPMALCSMHRKLLFDISKGAKSENELPPKTVLLRQDFPPGNFALCTKCRCPICSIVRGKVEIGHQVSSNAYKKPFQLGRPPKEIPEPQNEPLALENPQQAPEPQDAPEPVAELAPEPQEAPDCEIKCCESCIQIWNDSTAIINNMELDEIRENC